MVGYDPHKKGVQITETEQALSGAMSGFVTRCVCQPLDVVKVRFQLQIEPISKQGLVQSKYWGISQAFLKILHEEGAQALWKGHIPAQALSVSFGLVQFLSFEILTKHLYPINLPQELEPVYHFVCGGMAGCAASIASQPMDVLRTRLVAQGEPKVYYSIGNAVRAMYVKEGWTCFFKGLSPTLLQIAPQTGLQFGFYSGFVRIWDVLFRRKEDAYVSGPESLACGSLAGASSKAAVYPFDLCKKRLQVMGFEEARKAFGQTRNYRNLRDCMSQIVREEGIRGLYKGIIPSLYKAGLSVGITFFVYEQLCKFFRSVEMKKKS